MPVMEPLYPTASSSEVLAVRAAGNKTWCKTCAKVVIGNILNTVYCSSRCKNSKPRKSLKTNEEAQVAIPTYWVGNTVSLSTWNYWVSKSEN